MNKILLVFCVALLSMGVSAQAIIRAARATDGIDLCFHKQVQMKNYAYANIIGKCAWDPAMNGMNLTLVAVSEDRSKESHRLNLDNIRDVVKVENQGKAAQITVIQDTFDANDNVIQIIKVITVKSINKFGTFSIDIK